MKRRELTMAAGVVLLVVALALALGACSSSGSSNSAKPSSGNGSSAATKTRPQITVEAQEYGFVLPSEIPAGWVDVTIHDRGQQGHQIAFVKLGSMTYAAFKARLATSNLKDLPADTVFAGGPNNAGPGESVTATVHLEPGAYGVACFIPDDKDGKSHAEHGMVAQVQVASTAQSTEEAPAVSGGTLSLSEFTFVPDASFTGKGVVKFDNVGVQVHEAIIMKINAGKTLSDVKSYFLTPPGTPPPSGPPPFTTAGGIVGLGPHQTMYQTLALTPGKYALLCFFPDPTKPSVGGQAFPHALEGMVKEISIS
ncbi:MAG TPA: hypothetical protein VN636_03470 [Acidimicrobiia bacterium]|nr:hypothetical protein [Acidimicrobiia bacterium]